ncbi:MAG: T9SS type A sorting domain-containing protein [Algicola sp.]|nr:T9SS type A sorting domain-containing protein [Algicola sp.]
MKGILCCLIAFCMTHVGFSQVVINELDCDTPGVDTMEFVELLSETPNFPLDGYVVVFFNGSASGMNSSYFTVDLDGYQTDINGLLLIGSNSVSPVPQYLISENVIQNGADAVAIYQADDIDFPEETTATIENLVDVLIYGTADADDTDMIALFSQDPRFATIQQINEGSGNNTNSIQRFVDINDNVTYTATTPTPRQLNDGSGVVLNGISIAVAQSQYDEGESFDITFTSETPVTSDLNFNILLSNNGFDAADFTGNLSITIPMNQSTTTTTINLIDDSDDEGDEVTRIRFESLPTEYLALNNNLEIRIVDNDFVVANFGTPINPTFGNVASTQPDGYYDSLDGLADGALRQALQDIIAEEGVVRAQTYTDIIDILKEADQNPENSNEVWLVYTEQGRPKLDFQTGSDNTGKWNREHTYPRSRGGFFSIEDDDFADGIENFWNTTADSLRHGNSDAHALRAADGVENSSRNNQHYGQYIGPVNTQGSFYGDVARSVLYMEIRFNGLQVVNGFPEGTVGELGDLATLLTWHRNDPPDDFEMNRNNVIYNWQFNRNPFIDQPDLVEYIWGTNVGDAWDQPLSVSEEVIQAVNVVPNPTTGSFAINGLKETSIVKVFSLEGRLVETLTAVPNQSIAINLSSGIYLLQLQIGTKTIVNKLVVN